ncbi:uncharacterized protein LOC125006379 [Mugil cephalus]|uniref:uncharacterized protein LOC125006379 n=1 Tax=Mugil cephalus TaxID=48193 RepID=UPI001FB68364|nr:uncharacterized protein LOC125006379 [Mugil cephalus]
MLTITIHKVLPPKLTVTPQLITETESVALICETPSSVSVSQCFLFFMRTNTSRAVSCLKPLTGTELLSMSQQSSPAEVEVTCYYTVERRGEQHPSPHSNRASISILKLTGTRPSTTTQEMTTQTITSFRMTTALTLRRPRMTMKPRSASLTSVKPTLAIMSDDTGRSSVATFLSASVKTTKDSLTSADPKNPASGDELRGEIVWTVGTVVTLSVVFLGFALLSHQSRIGKCASTGAKVSVVDDWKSLADYDETYSIVTYECKNV